MQLKYAARLVQYTCTRARTFEYFPNGALRGHVACRSRLRIVSSAKKRVAVSNAVARRRRANARDKNVMDER